MADDRRRAALLHDLIFERPGGLRFTQDSPVLSDVWLAYALGPRSRQKLILTLSHDRGAGQAASELGAMLTRMRGREVLRFPRGGGPVQRGRTRISHIPGQISAELFFDELMRLGLPLTPWWQETRDALLRLADCFADKGAEPADWTGFPMHSPGRARDLTEALRLHETGTGAGQGPRTTYLQRLPADLLWLVRLAGLIGAAFLDGHALLDEADTAGRALEARMERRRAEALRGPRPDSGEDFPAEALVDGFFRIYEAWNTAENIQPAQFIWRVTRNRPVELAISRSALTVKADAARRLFDVSCREITWAVIDSGIDTRHPAFADTSVPCARGEKPPQVTDLPSRVVLTLDFTRIRDLLDADLLGPAPAGGEEDADVASARAALRADLARRLKAAAPAPLSDMEAEAAAERHMEELRSRIRLNREVDWEALRPLIEEPDPPPPPTDHGTHVAGIIGADWIDDMPGEAELPLPLRSRVLQGMCPDIRLIDVRVFREDGQTDEFELLAALQYLRWMNARAGYMAVHGANLSLSLVHEVRRYACGHTPICIECDQAVALGMVIVAAAGNRGFDAGPLEAITLADGFRASTITDPGNAQKVITVGATHRGRPHEYGVSYFSSRGPTGDGRMKPDLVAPGEKILGPVPGEGQDRKDGTSMAAPHVSGAAALLMARHDELRGRPERVKEVLCATATDLGRERYFQGAGLLDALRALQSL
ncbi:S8 family peptidase [Oceanicella sp. SM1341]|uniref:S8 family peptidase n=1 Tax=Oceanicella sp. SM1341 TaxID=1548889 RepID=UPI000E4A8CCE|nr:S8 family peptidase [Oceanicella sp. SM1341]